MKKKADKKEKLIRTVFCVIIAIVCGIVALKTAKTENDPEVSYGDFDYSEVPEYSDKAYVVLNGNKPYFEIPENADKAFEDYSKQDDKGRCGAAFASVCIDTMPTEDRESISSVKPSGWQSVQYDNVDGKSLYNRCHLIGFQLTAENANPLNLITGTRYMNTVGMLPFENMTADYVKETHNHVLYKVTPVFIGDELVARGVIMEAYSVEDEGDGVCFNVFCYNVQPGIIIDYSDGKSHRDESVKGEEVKYILNTNSHKFHLPTCPGLVSTKDSNKQEYRGTREDLIAQGYDPCSQCKP